MNFHKRGALRDSDSETLGRERQFHDQWALNTPLDDVPVLECFEGPVALENRFIVRQLGSLTGKKLLDVGVGLGESSVYFAKQGAEVTAVDLSPEMVDRSEERRVGKECRSRWSSDH